MFAPGHGSGGGPSNPSVVVTWMPITYNSVGYWTPLFQ